MIRCPCCSAIGLPLSVVAVHSTGRRERKDEARGPATGSGARPSRYGPRPMEPTTPAEPLAYAWPLSVAPGEPVALHASGPPGHAKVVVARIGAHREVLWTGDIDLAPHPIPATAAAEG